MNSVEKYVETIIKKMSISKKEKEEYKLQFIDHINSLKEEYIQKGFLENEAINLAIKDFGNEGQLLNTQELNADFKSSTRLIITSIFFAYIFILFGHYIKLAGAEGNAGNLAALNSLIPLKTIIGIIHGIILYGFNNWYCDLLITYILLFIPIGVLIPIIFTKFKTLRENIKLFIIIALGIQFIKLVFLHKVVNIDFALMNIIGCIIGYKVSRLVYSRLLCKVRSV